MKNFAKSILNYFAAFNETRFRFSTKNPDRVTRHNFDQEYLKYDTERQLELESYGYSFLRINKFSLIPDRKDRLPVDVLNELLEKSFA